MNTISKTIQQFFSPLKPLPPGMYHYQAPPEDPRNYRLHLRIDSSGKGMLVVNASTILHLNQSAAEYAYHIIRKTDEDAVIRSISRRYRISPQEALFDFRELRETIDFIVTREDLDPEIFLDVEPTKPADLSVPLRLDCALTYLLPGNMDTQNSPTDRVDEELSTSEWKAILDKAWNESILHIVFTGGEATLREDLPELIQHAELNGQITGLLTDGHKLVNLEYLNLLLQSGLDHLLFILNPEKDDSWQALENALQADLFVTTHLTLTHENTNQINSLIDRLVSMNCQNISLSCTNKDLYEQLVLAENKAAELDIKR